MVRPRATLGTPCPPPRLLWGARSPRPCAGVDWTVGTHEVAAAGETARLLCPCPALAWTTWPRSRARAGAFCGARPTACGGSGLAAKPGRCASRITWESQLRGTPGAGPRPNSPLRRPAQRDLVSLAFLGLPHGGPGVRAGGRLRSGLWVGGAAGAGAWRELSG